MDTVTVDKPVPVPCVTSIPPPPVAPVIADDADIEQRAAWARLRDAQQRQDAAQLRALLIACMEAPNANQPAKP